MALLFAIGFSFAKERIFVRNGFVTFAFIIAIVVATSVRNLLTLQYPDVDIVGTLLTVNNLFIILLWFIVIYLAWSLLWNLLKHFSETAGVKKRRVL